MFVGFVGKGPIDSDGAQFIRSRISLTEFFLKNVKNCRFRFSKKLNLFFSGNAECPELAYAHIVLIYTAPPVVVSRA